MYIDFSKLTRDAYGNIEPPIIILKRPHGDTIGVLGYAFNLDMELKFNEPSTASFSYPKTADGFELPFYDDIVKDKIIEIRPYGVFLVKSTKEDTDGIRTTKEIELVSREYELSEKYIVLEEGVYNFWNPADPELTILGQITSLLPNWHVGSVSASLIGKYRSFDSVDSQILSWLQGEIQESYGCAIIFDSYNQTINAIDANETADVLPVYLSYDNLLISGAIKELDDPIMTRVYVEGASGVDIRNVNPTGENYIYNLDWYIEKGDIPALLTTRWRSWENEVFANQPYYSTLISLRNIHTARLVAEEAALTELNTKRVVLENDRTTLLQMLADTKDKESIQWDNFQNKLKETENDLNDVLSEIGDLECIIERIKNELSAVNAKITTLNEELRPIAYFTDEEYAYLQHYFKEGSIQDDTFAVYDTDLENKTSYIEISSGVFGLHNVKSAGTGDVIESASVVVIENTDETLVGTIGGGLASVIVDGSALLSDADIISGTFHLNKVGGEFVCTMYVSPISIGDTKYKSGSVTLCAGNVDVETALSGMDNTTETIYSADGTRSYSVTKYIGALTMGIENAFLYTTKSASDYQAYSVSKELYNYASEQLATEARPTYEFEIESANIVLAEEFTPFREKLQLGCSCYLKVRDDLLLTPILNEIHLSFEDKSRFELVFSNTFRRPDEVNKFKDILKTVTEASRKIESNKFLYSSYANTDTYVRGLIQNGYDTALSQITAGKNNFVTIDGAGIKVASTDNLDVIQINNGMIALVDKAKNEVKMAMGHFYNPATGTDYVGVLADVIGGTLLAGQNLIIECPSNDPNGGVLQFKVDSNGVILNNGRFYIQNEKGAIGLDGNYGFFAGQSELFELTDDGYVSPACIDDDGNIMMNEDGFPDGVNVWIGIDGKVYLRGAIYAEEGRFNGIVQAADFLDKDGKSMLTDSGKFDGRILETETVVAANLEGEHISIVLDEETEAGYIETREASSADYGVNMTSKKAMALIAEDGNLYLESTAYNEEAEEDVSIHMTFDPVDTGRTYLSSDFCPSYDPEESDGYDLGSNVFQWKDIYASNGEIIASDEKVKTQIQYDLASMEEFYNGLKPATYKLVNGQSGRTHVGYIAQDVGYALENGGLSDLDFAGYIKTPRDNDPDVADYALRYSEFIALNTWQIQQLKTRVAELEDLVKKLTEVN